MRSKIALFAATVFCSAFLIFLVQPMVGKHILPWFGGVPAVWMLCLCFYQLALFVGYGYAHLLVGHLQVRRQFWLHALLFAAALLVLPVLPDASWKPAGGAPPGPHILAMLLANVFLPFLLLAATGPLLQAWYALALPGRSPYALFAVSNAGSLLALLAYPFVVEPNFPLSITSRGWSWGFAICGLAILGCAWLARDRSIPADAQSAGRAVESEPSAASGDALLWIALPACAVVAFMGVTNELCLDTASVPFLWIVPLTTYLLTFVLSFGLPKSYRRGLYAMVFAVAIGSLVWLRLARGEFFVSTGERLPIEVFVAGYLIALFAVCMLMHGELYRARPPLERLTAYYLCISGGGCLGGVFVGVVAPQIFDEYYELPLGWMACWLLFGIACARRPGPLLRRIAFRRAFAAGIALALGAFALATLRSMSAADGEVIYRKRSFFNILRVLENRPANPQKHLLRLQSGTTTHGAQLVEPDLRRLPIFYFGPATGIGVVMEERSDEPLKVGVIGLGVGSLAAYGRPGDRFRFYEIDPEVVRIARDEQYFTFLRDSPAEISIALGDARLSLESELEEGGPQQFDILVVDAFTSDSIPIHLLTVEAFELYQRHLKPGGVLAVHASSRHFNLLPMVVRQGKARGLEAAVVINRYIPRAFHYYAEWVILSADTAYIDALPEVIARQRKAMRLRPRAFYVAQLEIDESGAAPLWTDDYSDLFSALKKSSFRDLW